MKRTTKIWLTVAIVLVVFGALLFTRIMAKSSWDFSLFDTDEYKTETIEIKEGFDGISIQSSVADITFVPAADGKCLVEFYDPSHTTHSATVQNQMLRIEAKDTRKWFESLTISTKSPRLTVYLPQTQYASLQIKSTTGDIVLPEDFRIWDIDIATDTGDVTCYTPEAGGIHISTDTGDILLENASVGELDLSVSTGHIVVSSVVCSMDLSLTVSTGKSELTDVSCRNLNSQGSTGRMLLKNVIASGKISIERSTGDITFDKCDAAELLIKTDTGDVSGSLLSPKVFITQSDTGRIDVPDSVNGGKCKITTDTGDIKISTP